MAIFIVFIFFAGGIPERGLKFPNEVVPMRVSVSGTGGISVVVDPEVLLTMGPPILGVFDEEGGGTDHHK